MSSFMETSSDEGYKKVVLDDLPELVRMVREDGVGPAKMIEGLKAQVESLKKEAAMREVDVEKEKRAFGVLSDEASSLKATVSGLMVDAGIKNRDIASLKAEMSQLKRENERLGMSLARRARDMEQCCQEAMQAIIRADSLEQILEEKEKTLNYLKRFYMAQLNQHRPAERQPTRMVIKKPKPPLTNRPFGPSGSGPHSEEKEVDDHATEGPSSEEHRAALYGFPDDVEDIEDDGDDDGTLVRLSDVTADGRERQMLI